MAYVFSFSADCGINRQAADEFARHFEGMTLTIADGSTLPCESSTHNDRECALLFVGCVSLRGEENARTEFVSQCRLSSNEVTSIVSLAHSCGVTDVAEVRTYYIHPTTKCGITVTGAENINGRRVSYMT